MSVIDILLNNSSFAFPPGGDVESHGGFHVHPEHKRLLLKSSGLYAFDGGLHLFGVNPADPEWHSLKRWNNVALWKKEYSVSLVELYFAETSLGDQFYYDDAGRIGKLEAETGYKQIVANDFVEWVFLIEKSLEEMTDVDVLKDWSASSGKNIQPGLHLCPNIPFCLGGSIEKVEDGYLCNAVANMNFKGQLASQLSGLKPGDKVDLKVLNFPKSIAFPKDG